MRVTVLAVLRRRALALWLGIALSLVAIGSVEAQERIRVVTTTSDLEALAEAVGGERVAVTSIVPPQLDAETYEPRPRDIESLRGARMVVRIGLDYDLWLDRLLHESGNPALQWGRPGYVDASTGIALLEVRATALGQSQGHGHGVGNPHYWLDPANAEIITGSIIEGLERVDPQGSAVYRANRTAFLQALEQRIDDWRERLAVLQGQGVIAYHNTWPYFARRLRLRIVALIEPRPGIPPSPSHLAALIRQVKDQKVALIIKTPFEPDAIPRMLADRTRARVVVLAPSVGAVPEAGDHLSLFEYNVTALERALQNPS
jgi:ABC-type Zn uptake system ZnuABC Zn-binding protein ZnuA